MTSSAPVPSNVDAHTYGVLFVFAAGVLWSTVGLGIRLIEDAVVWQILLYRSISLSLFLYILIRVRSGESPFVQIRRIGSPAIIASGFSECPLLRETRRSAAIPDSPRPAVAARAQPSRTLRYFWILIRWL